MTAIRQESAAPKSAGLLGHLPAFRRDPLGFLTDCARINSSVVPFRMLHLPVFLLLDPADIERVLVTDHRNFIKPAWLRTPAVRRMLGNGLVTSEGEVWRRQRQACRHAFEQRRLEHYGEVISRIVERWLAKRAPGQTIDLQQEMARLTLEIVGRALFAIEIDRDANEMDWVAEASMAIDTQMVQFTAWYSLFGMIPWPPGPAEMRAARRLNDVAELLIRKHNESLGTLPNSAIENGAGAASLVSLLENDDATSGRGQGRRALRDHVKTFLATGHESSAVALCWAFLLLSQHPVAQAELQHELETVLCGRPPTTHDLPKLAYTRAVVHEAMRLYPPLWMIGRQAVQTCEIGGVSVPARAIIMTSPWAVQRLPRLFDKPNEFRPERWLNKENANLPRCAYFPFGAGPRICIGQSFAMMESVLLLAFIAQRFRLEPISETAIKPWATVTLRPPLGIKMKLTENLTQSR